jgi:3-methyladenine DNA glycosylase/8-oxoguanine DNA glycosylase
VAGATTLAGRLVRCLGTPLPEGGSAGLTHLFPTATQVAEGDLTSFGVPGARARAIRAFAQTVAAGEFRLDRSVGLERFVDDLCRLPGLGPWTAHYIALRMGEPDAFPASDLGLRRAVSPSAPVPAAELERLAEAWRPWRASVATRLWLANA